jgi:hypothetical protein
MERSRQFQQAFPDEKKEKPCQRNSEETLRQAKYFCESQSFCKRLARQFSQAGGADNPVVVFSDALSTKEVTAFWTARRRLACGMIETTLMDKRMHSSILDFRNQAVAEYLDFEELLGIRWRMTESAPLSSWVSSVVRARHPAQRR